MKKEPNKRVTFTLTPEMASFLNSYCAQEGVSRSEAVRRGLKLLQEKWLAEQYAENARTNRLDLITDDGGKWLASN